MINVWTQNDPFNNACDVVIITSRMVVSEVANDDGDDVQTLGNVFYW